MALSLEDLGFASGQNSTSTEQTSLANAAANNTDSNIAMNDFTATSVDSISGSTSIDVGNSSTYSMQFSGESSRFSEIKNTDQAFSWGSTDTSIITVSSGDFDTTATGQADGSALISSSIRDGYNFDDVTVTLNVTVNQPAPTTFSPFDFNISVGSNNTEVETETINNVSGLIGEDVQFALDGSGSANPDDFGSIVTASASIRITSRDSSGAQINQVSDADFTSQPADDFNRLFSATLTNLSSNTDTIDLRRQVNTTATGGGGASAQIKDTPTPQVQTI